MEDQSCSPGIDYLNFIKTRKNLDVVISDDLLREKARCK